MDTLLAESRSSVDVPALIIEQTTPEPLASQEVVTLSNTEKVSSVFEQGFQQDIKDLASEFSHVSDTEITQDSVNHVLERPYIRLLKLRFNTLPDKQDFNPVIDEECFEYPDELLNFNRLMIFIRDIQ
ncbi:uncharacterized protein LOC128222067 [Mya arenaria]|uniref:uncharacterized protein LOC128222067 n=1 Tax=Mya arenaria TaxID=6604 RepID=UPI0022E3115D|nr:uncharacterized protein LOC128222067 [Mya arenaria]